MKKYINDTLEYYNSNANSYKEKWNNEFLKNYDFDIPDIFLSYIKENSYILDLGCGTGRDSKYFLDRGYDVKSIDGSKEMCEVAKELLNKEVDQINFLDIDYKYEFDGVFACASLLHLSNQDLIIVLNKISDSLKQNGILYASFKYGNIDRLESGRYFNDMTFDKFSSICKNITNFKILKVWMTNAYDSDKKFINFIIQKN